MNYEIHKIQQDPSPRIDALRVMGGLSGSSHSLDNSISQPPHVRIRRARRDHEEIGGIAQPTKVENLNPDAFAVADGRDSGADRMRQARSPAVSQTGKPQTPGNGSC